MAPVSPPEFTTLTHNNPLLERFLRWPMVVLLRIGGNCSLFASKPAHISGHLPEITSLLAMINGIIKGKEGTNTNDICSFFRSLSSLLSHYSSGHAAREKEV
jgi:hypothetical protein